MGEEYVLNRRTEVVPLAADRYELRLALWGQTLPVTAAELAILRRFDRWTSAEGADPVLVEKCLEGGFLLARSPSGQPKLPQRTRVSETILAAPHHDPHAPARLTALGVPLDSGPRALRRATIESRYALDPDTLSPRGFFDYSSGRHLLAGVSLADAGDVFVTAGEDPHDTWDRITSAVGSLVALGTTPVILGGDHSITYPVLRALPHRRIGIIHLDARPDLGEGGLDRNNVFSVVLERLEFVERIHQIGLFGLISGTASAPARASWYGVDRVRSLGAVMLAEALADDLPYYVSLDASVFHPGGLAIHEVKAVLRAIASTREIIGIDLVEFTEDTARVAIEALLTVADGVRPR